jgi:hypothetical protein
LNFGISKPQAPVEEQLKQLPQMTEEELVELDRLGIKFAESHSTEEELDESHSKQE